MLPPQYLSGLREAIHGRVNTASQAWLPKAWSAIVKPAGVEWGYILYGLAP